MILKKFMPTRANHDADLVADLDEMMGRDIKFRLHGREYVIKKVSTENYFHILQAFDRIQKMSVKKDVTEEEAINLYYGLFSSCIDSFSKKTIKEMSVAQAAALAQLIFEHSMGRIGISEEAKKKV